MGKIVELSVKKAIHGEKIDNLQALANPNSLLFFKKLYENKILNEKKLLKQIDKKRILIPFPLLLASISAKFFELLPKPILTVDQLKLLRHNNVVSGKYKSNFDLGLPSTRYFEKEVEKYSYMWKEGGQFSTEKYKS